MIVITLWQTTEMGFIVKPTLNLLLNVALVTALLQLLKGPRHAITQPMSNGTKHTSEDLVDFPLVE